MKKAFFSLLILASLTVTAQNTYAQAAQAAADAYAKDTVVVPLYEKSDTVAASYLYEHRTFVRKANGFVILKGFTVNGKWAQQPKVVGVLDNKKKPVKKVIQIL